MKIIPRTKLGKWSVVLAAVFVTLMLLFFAMIHLFGQRGGETFFSNLLLTIPVLIAFGSATASCIVGIISFITSKERALLVFVSVIAGLIVTIYGVMELAFPH